MQNFSAFARTVFKCMKNKQTNKLSSLYIDLTGNPFISALPCARPSNRIRDWINSDAQTEHTCYLDRLTVFLSMNHFLHH